MRRIITPLLLIAIAAVTVHAQVPATPQTHATQVPNSGTLSPQVCKAALSRARKLISLTFPTQFLNLAEFRLNGSLVSVVASSLKSTAGDAHHLTDRLMACSILEQQKHEKDSSALADEFSTFGIALSDITEFGNMYNWTPPDDNAFPSDLPRVAPACGPVIASRLPERIEKLLGSSHSVPSGADVQRLSQEADPAEGRGLTICAGQAYRAGYVGAAWRLLTDESMLRAAEVVSLTN